MSIEDDLKSLNEFVLEEEEILQVKLKKDKRRRKIIAMKLEEFERTFGCIDAYTFNQIIKL